MPGHLPPRPTATPTPETRAKQGPTVIISFLLLLALVVIIFILGPYLAHQRKARIEQATTQLSHAATHAHLTRAHSSTDPSPPHRTALAQLETAKQNARDAGISENEINYIIQIGRDY